MDTPLIIKTGEEQPWSDESMFYMLTADGLFLCRNHEWFTSSVKTDEFPDELAKHRPFMKLRYPRLAADQFEMVVGFFSIIADLHRSEAIVLLAHHTSGQTAIVVPQQVVSPAHADYDMPQLSPGWRWFGDIHSHVNMDAFSSFTDETDETHRPGLHIVVGRISNEPPEFHVEVVVDGARFRVKDILSVVAGYKQRRPDLVPDDWMAKVSKKVWPKYKYEGTPYFKGDGYQSPPEHGWHGYD